ncbi:hypothetical protein NEUTE2DRAFT_162784 [Neurospora tetrasperma FGSC 2509]|nr:hypothetical protein NEUTE2DRAFT_162784 [Neurospora tetrasperma FGSC 2509]
MELLRDRAVEGSIQQPQRLSRDLHKPPVLPTLVGYTSRPSKYTPVLHMLGSHRPAYTLTKLGHVGEVSVIFKLSQEAVYRFLPPPKKLTSQPLDQITYRPFFFSTRFTENLERNWGAAVQKCVTD